MIQSSLTFLAMPIPAAMKTLGSLRTIEDMPEPLLDGLVGMIEALMNCFPEAAGEYHAGSDFGGLEFNHATEAHRLLSSAVEVATYPLHTQYGTMLEDTPLVMALAPGNALHLLEECAEHEKSLRYDTDSQALFDMTWKLTHTYPSIAAELNILLNEGGVGYYPEACKFLKEAMSTSASQPELAMAA